MSVGVLLMITMVLSWAIQTGITFAQPNMVIDCYGTIESWKVDRRYGTDPTWRAYVDSCYCPSETGSPVCRPSSTGLTPSGGGTISIPSGSGLDPSLQIQLMMFQSFITPLFNAIGESIRQSMLDSLMPSQSKQDVLRQQEEMRRRQEEEAKRQAYEQWMNELKKAELARLAEEQKKREEGQKILAKARIGSEGLRHEPIGGKLEPFSWSKPEVKLSPQPTTQYPAPKSAVEQMMCAAFFSELSNEAASRGDIEMARFYGDQMSNVMQGAPTAIKCSPPKNLTSNVDLNKAKELNRKYTEMSKLYQEVMPKIEKLSNVEVKLNEVKAKKEYAEQKIKEIDKQIEEIKASSKPEDPPEKKAKDDDLLAQALALKGEAERQYQEAVQLEEKLSKEKENLEIELNAIKEKIKAGGQ